MTDESTHIECLKCQVWKHEDEFGLDVDLGGYGDYCEACAQFRFCQDLTNFWLDYVEAMAHSFKDWFRYGRPKRPMFLEGV